MPDPNGPPRQGHATRRQRAAWRFWRPDVVAEVDEEIRFHLEMRAAEYEDRGFTPDAASRAARERFGNLARIQQALVTHDIAHQHHQDRRERMDRLARDVRLALRGFRRTPGFTAAVVA